jgi:hypothetical protein
MRTEEMTRELTQAELDQVSGAKPNLGGYTYCTAEERGVEGLYVGSCNPWADWMHTYFGV